MKHNKKDILKLWKYEAFKILRGRLVRIYQRKIAKAKLSLSARQQEILNLLRLNKTIV